MIRLYTGVPGAGKTTTMVADLLKLRDAVIFSNVRGLNIPHEPFKGIDLSQYPDNATIVIDECQGYMRTGSKIPAHILAQWEMHRHRGLEIYMTSQSPEQISKSIFVLVGKHVHTRLTRLAERQRLEWDNAQRNPNTPMAIGAAIRSFVRLDRTAMKNFDSVVEGAAQKVRRAKRARWPFVIGFLLLGLLGYAGYTIFNLDFGFEGGFKKSGATPPAVAAPASSVAVIAPAVNAIAPPVDAPASSAASDPLLAEIARVRAATEEREAHEARMAEHYRLCRTYALDC